MRVGPTERLDLEIGFGSDGRPWPSLEVKLRRVARSDAPVMLRGGHPAERERIAHAIHHLSTRAAAGYLTRNCGSLPEAALLRVLALPAASPDNDVEPRGLVAAATGGAVFLDEVERLPADGQAALIRWIRGGDAARVRIMCGAGPGLEVLVEQGRFRRDLYYRLNVISLWVRDDARPERGESAPAPAQGEAVAEGGGR